MDVELLKRLCDLLGISGREGQVRSVVAEILKPLVDEVRVDDLGNLIAIKRGTGPKIMLDAHMDEIGFMVSHIDDKGFLRFSSVGGNKTSVLNGQRVHVHGRDTLRGVLFKEGGWRRDVQTEKPARMEDFYVDLGLPREEVVELVEIGCPITIDQPAMQMGELICGKAMDNRAGLFAMIEAMRRLRSHEAEIYAVGSVQEEVGCRGAKVAAYGLMPDAAVVLDVCPARETPGFEDDERMSELGKGVAITVMDQGTISDPRLMEFFRRVADEEGIPYQMQITDRGGTDARDIHQAQSGIPAISLPIPARNTHSSLELVHPTDLRACAELVVRFLERAHEGQWGEAQNIK